MKREIWSATRIDVANYCRMRYYLIYVEKEKRANLSAYEKGSLLHKLIENFWQEENGKKIPKYKSAEEFAEKAQKKWAQRLIVAEKTQRNIDWKFEDEKWQIRSQLEKICTPLYEFLVNEGPPLYSEIPFCFSYANNHPKLTFIGKIDEIRIPNSQVILRDYKSGNPYIGEMKINHDPQMTLYMIGLASLCSQAPEFARSLGLEEQAKTFMGNPVFISNAIHPEFFMVEALASSAKPPHKPQVIHQTSRKDEHFFELLKMIQGTIQAVENGTIYPERGRKCDSCDVKKACEARLPLATNKYAKDLQGQLIFEYASPLFQKPLKPLTESKAKQKRFRWKK